MPDDFDSANNDVAFVTVRELDSTHHLFERLQELREFYREQFDGEPQFFVRMPGRVNIIGEHVDYCGYPVLPMAIDQCILLAVGYSQKDTLLQLRNADSKKFDNFKCDLQDISAKLEDGPLQWYKYYLCGVKGIYEQLCTDEKLSENALLGMTVALCGNVPPAAGLSSSSALVSASVLATAHVHGLPLDRKRLAAISASCERYIGTQGGGMDQAIAYLAEPGCAQFIEFHPQLNATPIRLPDGACFIVANSLAEKNKAASSDFNERVVECRLGARIIAKSLQLPNWSDIMRFKQLQHTIPCDLLQLKQLIDKYLPKELYTREDICQLLDVTKQELEGSFLTTNTRHMTTFKLRQRAMHVIEESLRVENFCKICESTQHHESHFNGINGTAKSIAQSNGNCTEAATDKLSILSKLMCESHESLRSLYECSHPDLERLISISKESGVGARLTGAGWGGCIVALCDSLEASAEYIRLLKEKYFYQLPNHIMERHQHNDFNEVVFATFPGSGAEIFKLSSMND